MLDQAEHDDGVRVIIVTGAGEDFCVGADSQALEGHVSRVVVDASGAPMPGAVVTVWPVSSVRRLLGASTKRSTTTVARSAPLPRCRLWH